MSKEQNMNLLEFEARAFFHGLFRGLANSKYIAEHLDNPEETEYEIVPGVALNVSKHWKLLHQLAHAEPWGTA